MQATQILIEVFQLYSLHAKCANYWQCKAQKSIALSSLETEFDVLSEAVKAILFIDQLLESMEVEVNFPITVKVINEAIFVPKIITTTSHTKHVDIRYNFVKTYVKDLVIKMIFVESQENDRNIMTKNPSGDTAGTVLVLCMCDTLLLRSQPMKSNFWQSLSFFGNFGLSVTFLFLCEIKFYK